MDLSIDIFSVVLYSTTRAISKNTVEIHGEVFIYFVKIVPNADAIFVRVRSCSFLPSHRNIFVEDQVCAVEK